jgi:hypothetical protein
MRGYQIRQGRLSRARWTMTASSAAALAAGFFFAGPPAVSASAAGVIPSSVSTTVVDAATAAPWAGTETTGASAYDTSAIGGVLPLAPTPTGTVTYNFFLNGACTGIPASTQAVTLLADGSVPNSSPTAALAAGSYAFQAAYSGDSNYAVSRRAARRRWSPSQARRRGRRHTTRRRSVAG